MRLQLTNRSTADRGVTLFGVVLMLSIVVAFALVLAVIIPNIRREGLNDQRLVDVDSIRQALSSYIASNDAIPKSWSDVQDQIDLDHYEIDSIVRSLGSNEQLERGLEIGRQAASEANDYVGIFARAQCNQPWIENATNQNLIKDGSERQIAILYMLEGVGLVCDQINPDLVEDSTESTDSPTNPADPQPDATTTES